MTFDEWFNKEYPESAFAAHMQIIRLSLKEVAQKAWEKSAFLAYQEGLEEGRYG